MSHRFIILNPLTIYWVIYCRDYRHTTNRGVHGSPVQRYILPAHQQPHLLPGTSQFAPFSPGVAPPPAHQSPRHMQYATHPLPAHLNPLLPSPGLHPAGSTYPASIMPSIGAPTYANSSLGAVYTTYPISPTKTRQYQYLYRTFGGEWLGSFLWARQICRKRISDAMWPPTYRQWF